MKHWLLGCLNSAMHSCAKFTLLVIGASGANLAAFFAGHAPLVHLDPATLAYAYAVGILYGGALWASNNPLPDDSIIVLSPGPSSNKPVIPPQDKIDT